MKAVNRLICITILVLMAVSPAAFAEPEDDAPGVVVNVTDATFEAEVLNAGVPVLVEFWAPWCGYCKKMTPVMHQIAAEYKGRVKVVMVNKDKNKESAAEYNVSGIPAFFMHDKNGYVTADSVGARSKEQLVRDLGIEELLQGMDTPEDEDEGEDEDGGVEEHGGHEEIDI